MNLIGKFLSQTEFSDYADFKANAKITVPDNFNFGFDVVDEYARLAPEKRALVWCNHKGEEKTEAYKEEMAYIEKMREDVKNSEKGYISKFKIEAQKVNPKQ